MNKDKDFLGTEPVGKLMFRLALPTITAQLINMLYNIIDRIYIGHIPGNGALALTGVGVCMPLITYPNLRNTRFQSHTARPYILIST